MTATLAPLDWAIIGLYLLLTLIVGATVSRRASTGLRSYFQADGTLPWWWAGTSIAATTFAADTPLAITGLVAAGGLANNWMWLSWAALHVAVICFFSDRWQRSGVLSDAELVSVRYSGPWAPRLRVLKALLYGCLINAIILGWVVRAMSTIVAPYIDWRSLAPGLVDVVAGLLPAGHALGEPGSAITIVLLTLLVALYSSAGGLRGVVLTDLVQFALAMVGAVALAWVAVPAAGGLSALASATTSSGQDATALFPSALSGWQSLPYLGGALTALYLFVQSVANNPADGGGYLMQRLSATRSSGEARGAAGLFVVLNYLVRPWPWFLVALAALVLIPVGHETEVFGGRMAEVATSREAAYPALIAELLPAGLKGILIASLMAAFMSTVDTHINWGASYLANDLYRAMRPRASERELVGASRSAVVLLAAVAILSAMYIGTIEGAWRALASIGAGLAAPTALRWLWWRVNASAELFAIVAGLGAWLVTGLFGDRLAYELRLIVIGGSGALVCVVCALLAPATAPAKLESFVERVQPLGYWTGPDAQARRQAFWRRALAFALLLSAVYGTLFATRELFFGSPWSMAALAGGALAAGIVGWNVLERGVRRESDLAPSARHAAVVEAPP